MTEYLELNATDCTHCYKCLRDCPVKAISFKDNQATILQDECVLCGRCFTYCPQSAKQVRNDVSKAKSLLASHEKVIASVAPSFVANYPNASIETVAQALEQLGFFKAEETALGATVVKKQYDELVNKASQEIIISTSCHTVNSLVEKYYPEALPFMANFLSPMQAHCTAIKKQHPTAATVFIGPCISKKEEGELYPGVVDCVLTFEELDGWLKKEGVQIAASQNKEIGAEGRARLFPTTGGILRSMEKQNPAYSYIAIDGMDSCINALENIASGNIGKAFIEMSACSGSCVGGPAMSRHPGVLHGYVAVNKYAPISDFTVAQPPAKELDKKFAYRAIARQRFGEKAVVDVLRQIGKTTPEDELNCGSCGYDTCREKAQAVLAGKASLEMCLPYLMSKAKSISDTIIRSTPNGIIVLNDTLEIQEINAAACRMLHVKKSSDVMGRSVVCILEPGMFLEVIENNTPIYENRQYLAEYNRYINFTVIQDKDYGLVIGIMRDITESETEKAHKREIAERTLRVTDDVLEKQMRTVQEIASLLGETAAETQIALTKLKETLSDD